MKKLFSIQEAADILRVHPETLRRWDREGRLQAIKVGERGDRKYRYEDLLKIIAGYKPEKYKKYEIVHYSYGFEPFPNRFGTVAKLIVKGEDFVTGFAFAVAGLKLFAYPHFKDDDLLELAKKEIKKKIDRKTIRHLKEYTYEFDSGSFYEVKNPEWWTKNKYD